MSGKLPVTEREIAVHLLSVSRLIALLSGFLVLKVTAGIVWEYASYFPADFNSDFLRGRETYFFLGYAVPFYTHIIVGPLTLLLGGFLIIGPLRRRFRSLHRVVGRVQVVMVLFLLAPSGFWLAFHSAAGWVGTVSFALLSIATGYCVLAGWRTAVRRQFKAHERWMERCFLLLCSAIALRLMAGLAVFLQIQVLWFDAFASMACWTLPWLTYEIVRSQLAKPVRTPAVELSVSSANLKTNVSRSS